MVQIKLFSRGFSDTADQLERDVNDWLREQGDGIEILDRSITSSCGTNVLDKGFVNVTIMLTFRPRQS